MIAIFRRNPKALNKPLNIDDEVGETMDNNVEQNVPSVEIILFSGKQNIPWHNVEMYLKKYIGHTYTVAEYKDDIFIGSDFPDEYAESKYTKSLRGAAAKANANAAQIIDSLIICAKNRRWVENKDIKHNSNASAGRYRYDTFFSIPVQGSNDTFMRANNYKATLIVRKTTKGLFLYDLINIKKEASTPLESN